MQIVNTPEDKLILKSPIEEWTHSRFKYELFIRLTKVQDPNKSDSVTDEQRGFLLDKKYYAQARRLIYWIPISKPAELIPPFIIHLSDLTPRIRKEFQEFIDLATQKEAALFLKEIAVRFFEKIDYSYTHDSVIEHLQIGYEE